MMATVGNGWSVLTVTAFTARAFGSACGIPVSSLRKDKQTSPGRVDALSIAQAILPEQSSGNVFNGSFVRVILILTAAAVQVKAPTLWSESRTLRKLQAQSMFKLQGMVVGAENGVDAVFVELYSSLSKGRHRSLGRTFGSFYFLFTAVLDMLDIFTSADILMSEAIMALRGLIYAGSFAVLGARKLTYAEVGGVVGLAILYGTYVFLAGFGLLVVPRSVGNVLFIARIALVGLWSIGVIFQFVVDLQAKGTNLSQIVSSMREGRLRPGSQQALRYDRMKQLANTENSAKWGTAEGAYWWPSRKNCLEMCALTLLFSLNGVAFGGVRADHTLALAAIESFEIVCTLLLVLNDTQVEPTLFIRLLNISFEICQNSADS